MSNNEQDRITAPPEGGAEAPSIPEGGFRYGYSKDGSFSIDLGDGLGPQSAGKESSSRLDFIPEPVLPEDVVSQLEEARVLREKYAEVEPLAHLKDRDDFKQWLRERVESGDISDPNPPPSVAPEDIVGTQQRRLSPEYEAIRLAMIEYSESLNERDAQLLQTNHKIFNETFDRFKASYKGPVPGSRPVGAPLSWNAGDLEKSIAAKERAKEYARVEPPGGVVPDVDPRKQRSREISRLKDAIRNAPAGRRSDLETKLALKMFFPDAERG